MLWEIEFTDKSLQTVHTELVFAPGFTECREQAESIKKSIKKDAELIFHIYDATIYENC